MYTLRHEQKQQSQISTHPVSGIPTYMEYLLSVIKLFLKLDCLIMYLPTLIKENLLLLSLIVNGCCSPCRRFSKITESNVQFAKKNTSKLKPCTQVAIITDRSNNTGVPYTGILLFTLLARYGNKLVTRQERKIVNSLEPGKIITRAFLT